MQTFQNSFYYLQKYKSYDWLYSFTLCTGWKVRKITNVCFWVGLRSLFYVPLKRCKLDAAVHFLLVIIVWISRQKPHSCNHIVGLSYESEAGFKVIGMHSAQYTRSNICKSLVCNSVGLKIFSLCPEIRQDRRWNNCHKEFATS
jgi:hypothetical protein